MTVDPLVDEDGPVLPGCRGSGCALHCRSEGDRIKSKRRTDDSPACCPLRCCVTHLLLYRNLCGAWWRPKKLFFGDPTPTGVRLPSTCA